MHSKLTPTPLSSNIAGYAYDAATSRLVIAFNSGKHYLYEGVPAHTVQQFANAPSKGTFFGAEIRSKFPTVDLFDENALANVLGTFAGSSGQAKRKTTTRSVLLQLAQRYPFLRMAF